MFCMCYLLKWFTRAKLVAGYVLSFSCVSLLFLCFLVHAILWLLGEKGGGFLEELLAEKEMAEYGRVHPDCVNAANPYHECGASCLEKIGQGKGRKERKKSDYNNGIKQGPPSKKMDQQRRAHPSCPKASNPYHECGVHCSNRTADTLQGNKNESGSFILDNALSFGKKKKGPDSQPDYPRVVQNGALNAVHRGDDPSPPSSFTTKKNMDPGTSQSSSSQQHSEESNSQDHPYNRVQVPSLESVPMSGKLVPDGPKSPSKASLPSFAIEPPAEPEDEDRKIRISPKAASYPFVNNGEKFINGPNEDMKSSFSGISLASEESDGEETRSVISDSCVSVGKHHVRANVASTLQLIFDKYGDIAAGSRLESVSMRAYYLECLCLVVQELQSTSFKQLTKSKLKEMFAVLKDVESAQIDVSWLRAVLNELSEAVELNNQHQAAEEAKANCDNDIESTRKELDSLMEDLALKEKAVADLKEQIGDKRELLSKLELESSQLSDDISTIWSKVEKFHDKPLANEIL